MWISESAVIEIAGVCEGVCASTGIAESKPHNKVHTIVLRRMRSSFDSGNMLDGTSHVWKTTFPGFKSQEIERGNELRAENMTALFVSLMKTSLRI